MEGVALKLKLPSFKSLAPNAMSMSCAAIGHRVRRSFSLSACSAASSFPIIAADSESVSLGHRLRCEATDEYELAREKVARFINASDSREIVFTRNVSEAIDLVAYSWGLSNLKPGDEVLVTVAEHHSCICPWVKVTQKTGAVVKYVELNDDEVPDIDQLRGMISQKTKLVAVHHVSNVLGSCLPIEEIVVWAHDVGTLGSPKI